MRTFLLFSWIIFLVHFWNLKCEYEYVSQQTEGEIIYYKHDGKLLTGVTPYFEKEMDNYQSCIQMCEAAKDSRCVFLNVVKIAVNRFRCQWINAPLQGNQIKEANSSSAMYTKHIKLKCPQFCKNLKYMNICGDCQCVDLCGSKPYYCNCTKVKANSCLDLKPHYSTSGFYSIYLNGIPTTVYCDMITDGGGWTMISNLIVDSTDDATELSHDQIQTDDIYSLKNVVHGKYLLSTKAARMLDGFQEFQQLRLYCHKPHHGRTVHVTTSLNATGLTVMNFLLGKSDDTPFSCGSYELFPDDSSKLFQDNCANFGLGSSWSNLKNTGLPAQDVRLYNHAVFIISAQHFNLITGGRLECDDFLSDTGFETVGVWQYFLR